MMRTLMQLLLGIGLGLWLRDALYHRESARPARPESADDAGLRTITGIGPVFENALHKLGIRSFAQLAEQNADTLAQRLGAPASAERIRRERWIEQARERANA